MKRDNLFFNWHNQFFSTFCHNFKKYLICLCLERGRKEKERERNIRVREKHQLVASVTYPKSAGLGTKLATQACALTGDRTHNLWCMRQHSNQLGHQARARTFPSFPPESLCPSNTNSQFSPPFSAGNPHSTFCLYEFDDSGTSYKWKHTIFVLLCVAYLT